MIVENECDSINIVDVDAIEKRDVEHCRHQLQNPSCAKSGIVPTKVPEVFMLAAERVEGRNERGPEAIGKEVDNE